MDNEKVLDSIRDITNPVNNTNGLTNGSLSLIKDFKQKLDDLKIPPKAIYEYIEHNKKIDGVSSEIFDQLNALKKYELEAIKSEIPTIKSQIAIKYPDFEEQEQAKKQVEDFIKRTIKSSSPTAKVVLDGSFDFISQIKNLKVLLFFNWISPSDYLLLKEDEEKTPQTPSTDDERI